MTTDSIHDILETGAAIPTWFGCGGGADTLARPRSVGELRDLLHIFAGEPIRVLGDGANLLVDDAGVDGLVISLERLNAVTPIGFDESDPSPARPTPVGVRAQAGAKLPRLITDCVRAGLAGLEHLAGIPATVGGAAFMNAGGAFGDTAQALHAVTALTRLGDALRIPHDEINFAYRHSGLGWLVIVEAEFDLTRLPEGEQPRLRQRLKDVMAFKRDSQPLAKSSAGCAFKNPVVGGERLSAGMLIDRAGCKGLTVGGAAVSDVHANFVVTAPGCTARDVLGLCDRVAERVRSAHGVTLEPEIVVWRRTERS